jgi:hypothetical protein
MQSFQWSLRGPAAAFAFALVAAGCSTPTTMTEVWKDPTYSAGPMHNIVVFGGRVDATRRRALEDGLVAALANHGVHATASYTIFAELPNREAAKAAVQQVGADGFLAATMKGIHDQTTIEPGGYGGPFWGGYYDPGWGGYYSGYAVTDQFVKFETSLWDAHGEGKLVWSAVTQTENPSSGSDFLHSLLKKVIPALTNAGFIPPQQGNAVSYAIRPVTAQ